MRLSAAELINAGSARSDKIALRVQEASRVSGLSRSTLYKLISDGKLCSIKACGRRLILRTDLEAYFAQLRGEQHR
jgi:excisionase family DNA binding protein